MSAYTERLIKVYDGSVKEWNCPHVNKNDVYIVQDEHTVDEGLFYQGIWEHNTDWDEPKLPYKYVFLVDIFPDSKLRKYIPCECVKEKK